MSGNDIGAHALNHIKNLLSGPKFRPKVSIIVSATDRHIETIDGLHQAAPIPFATIVSGPELFLPVARIRGKKPVLSAS